MDSKNKPDYLPVRSLGDFIITAYVIKNYIGERVPIILPEYFSDLYLAINGDEYFIVSEKINLKNQPAFFELYKIRDSKNLKRLFYDIKNVSNQLKKRRTYLLDFRSRRLQYINAKFKWPADSLNIYQAKRDFFTAYFKVKSNSAALPGSISLATRVKSIVIFPESRIKEKEIPATLIDQIISRFPGIEVNVAKFSANEKPDELNYSNFNELINLIKSAAFVISSDSLPYHIANFYNVPHFVIYQAKSKFYTPFFRTPYIVENDYYSLINDRDFIETLNKLEAIFVNKAVIEIQ